MKFTLTQAMKAQRGVEVRLYSFFNLGTRWGWVVSATPQLLYLQDRDPIPVFYEAGWTPGLVWTGVENLAPHQDLIPRPSSL
jgi:hypothetical protein